MTSIWRRVIRLAVEWSRERVGIWSKTAWSGQGCAGCHPVRKRCWTYAPPTSMASGMPSGTSTSRRRMNGFTAKYGRLGEVNPVVTPESIHRCLPSFEEMNESKWCVKKTLLTCLGNQACGSGSWVLRGCTICCAWGTRGSWYARSWLVAAAIPLDLGSRARRFLESLPRLTDSYCLNHIRALILVPFYPCAYAYMYSSRLRIRLTPTCM